MMRFVLSVKCHEGVLGEGKRVLRYGYYFSVAGRVEDEFTKLPYC
jgi:hypothetical protein